MGYANAPVFSSPSAQSEQFAGHDRRVGQCLTTICSGSSIDTDRGQRVDGNVTEFNTYGAISVTSTVSTVRAPTLALQLGNAADAVISANYLALWSNRRENASLRF